MSSCRLLFLPSDVLFLESVLPIPPSCHALCSCADVAHLTAHVQVPRARDSQYLSHPPDSLAEALVHDVVRKLLFLWNASSRTRLWRRCWWLWRGDWRFRRGGCSFWCRGWGLLDGFERPVLAEGEALVYASRRGFDDLFGGCGVATPETGIVDVAASALFVGFAVVLGDFFLQISWCWAVTQIVWKSYRVVFRRCGCCCCCHASLQASCPSVRSFLAWICARLVAWHCRGPHCRFPRCVRK